MACHFPYRAVRELQLFMMWTNHVLWCPNRGVCKCAANFSTSGDFFVPWSSGEGVFPKMADCTATLSSVRISSENVSSDDILSEVLITVKQIFVIVKVWLLKHQSLFPFTPKPVTRKGLCTMDWAWVHALLDALCCHIPFSTPRLTDFQSVNRVFKHVGMLVWLWLQFCVLEQKGQKNTTPWVFACAESFVARWWSFLFLIQTFWNN